VASRRPWRLSLADFISFSISASVSYSRLRSSALGLRRGVTVRFTVVGDTSLRCDFAVIIRLLAHRLFVELRTASKSLYRRRGSPGRAGPNGQLRHSAYSAIGMMGDAGPLRKFSGRQTGGGDGRRARVSTETGRAGAGEGETLPGPASGSRVSARLVAAHAVPLPRMSKRWRRQRLSAPVRMPTWKVSVTASIRTQERHRTDASGVPKCE
jgi:hypothetical protein